MSKITMKSNTNLTFDEAFEKFIRKCKVKNLTEIPVDFNNKMRYNRI